MDKNDTLDQSNYIFLKDNNNIRACIFIIDKIQLKNIRYSINIWYGRGELKKEIADSITSDLLGKQVDVISKEYVGKNHIFYFCCPEMYEVDLFEFKYYEYTPHTLSKLCDEILNAIEPLDLSIAISEFLKWQPQTEDEKIFYDFIMNTFSFEKQDISKLEEKSILYKFINFLKNRLFGNKYYLREVDNKINSIKNFNSGFYARELYGRDFKFNRKEIREIKDKIFNSLPSYDDLII